jgi:tripartite ATP-independent transporter DctM subunit
LICVAMLMIATAIVAYRRRFPRATRWPTFRELWAAFLPAAPALLTPVLLVGGMLSGSFTPTEASAVCVTYILLIGFVVYREMNWGFVREAAVATVRTSAAVLIIVGAAAMFGWILAVEQVPQEFAAWFKDVARDPLVMLLIINVIFFIAGMFVDSTTATLLLVPIIAPPAMAAGIDPIHLGIVVVFNLMIGTITPPFGLSLFLLSSMTGVPMSRLLKAMLPFYPPLLVTLVILTAFPALVLWIPMMLR